MTPRDPVRPAYLSQADLIAAYRRLVRDGGWNVAVARARLEQLEREAGMKEVDHGGGDDGRR